ncbi:MAG: hypothetical protein ABIO44_04770 [Saprospiraceae bacterium]
MNTRRSSGIYNYPASEFIGQITNYESNIYFIELRLDGILKATQKIIVSN